MSSIRQQARKLKDAVGKLKSLGAHGWIFENIYQRRISENICQWKISENIYHSEEGDLPWPAMWSPGPSPPHPPPPLPPSRCFFSDGPEHHCYSFYKSIMCCRSTAKIVEIPFKWNVEKREWGNGDPPCSAGSGSVRGFPMGDCQIGPWSNKGCPLMTVCLKQAMG